MSRFRQEVVGLLVVLAAAYALLALYRGGAGEAGAVLAVAMSRALGAGAGAAAALLGLVGLSLLRAGSLAAPARYLAAGLLFVAALSCLLELVSRWPLASNAPWARAVLEAGAGGGLGRESVALLQRAVGEVGAYLAAGAAILVAAALALETGPASLAGGILGGLGRGVAAVLRVVARAGLAGLRVAGGGLALAGRGLRGAVLGRAPRSAFETPQPPPALPPPSRSPQPAGQRPGAAGAGDRRQAPTAVAEGPSGRVAPGRTPPPQGPEEAGSSDQGWLARPGGRAGWGTAPAAGRWRLPGPPLLTRPGSRRRAHDDQEAQERSQLLERTLASFGVEARVVSYTRGPVITRYELALAPGIKLSRVVHLADDLSLALATAGVRIEAPVPGKSVVGIEVPNAQVETVYLREVLESPSFARSGSPLTLALGKDVAGQPVVADLERLIHLLIAGSTGSGKSVCLASIIMSLLFRLTPDQLQLLLIDPKRVELTAYDGIPHLLAPVVTEVKQAALALRWAVREMEARYQELARVGARNLAAYHRLAARGAVAGCMPYVVVIIDELADLMMVAPADVEDSICRLAQMARAAGIHLVIATQRPSTDVITGLIKANIPSRLAFAVSSQVDSRTILDTGGAERLLGRGDMLYHPLGFPKAVRAQGCLVTEQDIERAMRFWKEQGSPEYRVDVFEEPPEPDPADPEGDELYEEAVRVVTEAGHASVSLLQRRFRIGYARAARLIDLMEQRGVVGPYQGSKPREVLAPHRRREYPA